MINRKYYSNDPKSKIEYLVSLGLCMYNYLSNKNNENRSGYNFMKITFLKKIQNDFKKLLNDVDNVPAIYIDFILNNNQSEYIINYLNTH